ncbi:MAG: GIY-YIG nuclease family protein [Kiritimatiellae bacterium]|nr:GIY-YIG nuclease family protein [Kiritimatiellia bacterium]
MIELTTMNVRFIGSKPDGIRICRVEGESLTTVIVPRELLSEAKRLPDIPKRGVYYLLDEDHGVIGRVYAGQTTQGLSRLDAHKSRKEFWNKAVMFLDDESNMDRDVLDALEARAIGYVRTHGSYETDNLETPQPYVDPYKEPRVRRLYKSILFRMAALGYGLDRTDDAVTADHAVFHTKRNGIVAKGRYDERTGSFTVLAGSQVDLSRPVLENVGAADARRELFGEGSRVSILRDDVAFGSPSSAAVFLLGGSRNGWIEWVNEAGRTLDAVYRGKRKETR